MKSANQIVNLDAYHPGKFIADEMSARSVTLAKFCAKTGIEPSKARMLFLGKTSITAKMAHSIEKNIGISSILLLKLQFQFEKASKAKRIKTQIRRLGLSLEKTREMETSFLKSI